MAGLVALILAMVSVTVFVSSTETRAAWPEIQVDLSGPATVLAGNSATYTVSASRSVSESEAFNLAFYVDVPPGITFASSAAGAPIVFTEAELPALTVPAGWSRWVWEDVSDLPNGASYSISFTVTIAQPPIATGVSTPDTDVHPVGAEFSIHGYAAVSTDPRFLPVFPGFSGVGGVDAEAATYTDGPDTVTTTMVPLRVRKSEPSPESELLRGLIDQYTTYRIVLTNTTQGPTNDVVVVDYLPAGLEFLGCGSPYFDDTYEEYTSAGQVGTISYGGTDCDSTWIQSVDTIVATAGHATDYPGVVEGNVYTEVVWNIGDLAPGEVFTLEYLAAIPLFENTMSWPVSGSAPDPSAPDLIHMANLENNTGPSTRHGSDNFALDGSVIDGDTWTNVAGATGDYDGVIRDGADRSVIVTDSTTVHAMDVSILKANSLGSDPFETGENLDFTLTLRSGEYMFAEDFVIVDTLPNGLCPLVDNSNLTEIGVTVPGECLVELAVVGAVVDSVVANADGTFEVTFLPDSGTGPENFLLDPNSEHTITYTALMRSAYETDNEYGATTSGDSFSNYVDFTATTYGIDELEADYLVQPELWEPYKIWDDSSAGLSSSLTTIDKRVMIRDEVDRTVTPGDNPCTVGTFVNEAYDFRFGDTACFELTVNFPNNIETRNAVVTDYLPADLAYLGHEVVVDPQGLVALDAGFTDTPAGVLRWNIGETRPGGRDDLYTPIGYMVVIHVWAEFLNPAEGITTDKTENLMKYRQQNVNGDLYFLRDEVDAYYEPGISLVKGIWGVLPDGGDPLEPLDWVNDRFAQTEDDPDGTVFASNRDGVQVNDLETIRFRVDLLPTTFDIANGEIWDLLPPGVEADDISLISDGGVAYDWDDLGYPADLDSTRTVVVWTGIDVDTTGYSLYYDLLIESARFTIESEHINDASVIQYSSGINSTVDPNDLTARVYLPCGSLDDVRGHEDNCTTDGEFTMDDSMFFMPSGSASKSLQNTEQVYAANGSNQVVVGEVAEYSFQVTIPANSSVSSGVLSDAFATASAWQVIPNSPVVTYPGGATDPGDTAFSVGAYNFTVSATTGTVTFPAWYVNETGAAQTFRVDLRAYVLDSSSFTHHTSTQRINTATFTSSGVTYEDEAFVYFIEPNPDITKTATGNDVSADQTVTYTLEYSNASGRPTLFDAVMWDCVPAELSVVELSITGSGVLSASGVGPRCGATEQQILWNVGDIAGGAGGTVQYDVVVDPDSAGAVSYTNTAWLEGESNNSASEVPESRTYTVSDDWTVTVIEPDIDKSVAFTPLNALLPNAVAIGQEVEYTITVTIPRDVNYYDAWIRDTTNAGIQIDQGAGTITCEFADDSSDCMGTLPGGGAVMTPSGVNYGWWLGNIDSNSDDRIVTITYPAVILNVGGNAHGTNLPNTGYFLWNTESVVVGTPTAGTTSTHSINDAASVVVQGPNLTIQKRVNNNLSNQTVQVDQALNYQVRLNNTGLLPAFDIVVTDTIPTNIVVNPATISHGGVLVGADPIQGGGVITWTIDSLANGTILNLSYSAVLAPSEYLTTAGLVNTARVTQYFSHDFEDGFDDVIRRQYGPVQTTRTVTPRFPNPVVTKTPTGAIAYIDEAHVFTIVVLNSGANAGTANNVVVEDVLPAGWAYVAGSSTVNAAPITDPAIVGQTLTWSGAQTPNLNGGQQFTLVYQAVPEASHPWDDTNTGAAFDHTNTVIVTVDDNNDYPENAVGPYDDDTDADVQIHRADLSLTKTRTSGQEYDAPTAGAQYQYTITVTNNGPDASVADIVVTDYLPADATYVSHTNSGVWAYADEGGGVISFTRATDMPNGNVSFFVVTVEFPADLADETVVLNGACITGSMTFDDDTSIDRVCDDVEELSRVESDLGIVKTRESAIYVPGEMFSWDIVVTNYGPSVNTGPIVVTDVIPEGIDTGHLLWDPAMTSASANWDCDLAAGTFTCTWVGGTLGVGASLPALTFTGPVEFDYFSTLTNTASVTSPWFDPDDPEHVTDPDPSNNSDSDSAIDEGGITDLEIVKTVASAELPAGEEGTYRLTITNHGPTIALDVVIEDELPTGLTFVGNVVSSPAGWWDCSGDGGTPETVTCTMQVNDGHLDPTGLSTPSWLEFDVAIASDVTGIISNTAVISSDTPETELDNNTSTVDREAFVETDISIVKTHDDSSEYQFGDLVEFDITVTNHGPADAENVRVVDLLPVGFAFDSFADDAGWTCAHVAGNVSCELDSVLEVGDTVGFTLVVEVESSLFDSGTFTSTSVINEASVETSTDESDDTNNDDSTEVDIVAIDLVVTKEANVTHTQAGHTVIYTLVATNVGDGLARADSIQLEDDLPSSVAFQSFTGTGWSCTLTGDTGGFGGTLECEYAPEVESGEDAATLSIEVEVSGSVAVDSITNRAFVFSDSEHPVFEDDDNEDDATVLVRWIDFTGSSVCIADVPWLEYSIDPRNIDNDLAITIEWYANESGAPGASPIATYVLDVETNGGVIVDSMLWPGAAVDEHGVGIAWPGWRVVTAGETPDWENYIEDPSLPEHALRAGAYVVVSINPDQVLYTDYPPTTLDCEVVRDPVLDIDKAASGTQFNRSQQVTYDIVVSNIDYGATNDVVITDPIDPRLTVVDVTWELSTDPEIADWVGCDVTDRELDGSGGLITCVLDGWLGYGQTAPLITVAANFTPGGALGDLDNIAVVAWTDPDGDTSVLSTADDDARVVVVLSMAEILAMTGFGAGSLLWWAVILLAMGGLFLWISRRQVRED